MTSTPPTTQTSTVIVGGHKYRVHSSASEDQLARLASLVDERLMALPSSQRGDPKSLVLIALGLAHDLEQEQQLRTVERHVMEQRVRTLIARVDEALGHVDLNGDPLPTLLTTPIATPTGDVSLAQSESPEQTPARAEAVVHTKAATRGSSETTRR